MHLLPSSWRPGLIWRSFTSRIFPHAQQHLHKAKVRIIKRLQRLFLSQTLANHVDRDVLVWVPDFEHRESLTKSRLLQKYLTIHKGLDVFLELAPNPDQNPQDTIMEQVAACFQSEDGLRRTRSCPAQDMSMTEVCVILRDVSGMVLNPEKRADL
mmetsp:Transcript_6257/g.22235  ORF Transcript_6257/g.22235 Transcript_6257/m.22235 type:complete len:155 (+) Transcript_6257:715-1179(+)